jgi:hypothetical protein
MALNFGWSVGWLVTGKSHERHAASSVLFCHLGPPFLTLLRPAGHPKNGLKFWSIGRLVGQSGGSHTNVTLPLQFRHPGPPIPTLLRPAGHPQNGLKFWSVGRSVGRLVGQSVGHREVTRMPRCLFSFVNRASPSRPFYALRATPKTALNFGWSVGWLVGRLVGWSVGRLVGWSVGRLVGWSVGQSVGRLVGWLVGRSVGRSVPTLLHPRRSLAWFVIQLVFYYYEVKS